MLSNHHLLPSLVVLRQKELWQEAQIMRQVRESKRHRPGVRGSLAAKACGLIIVLGRRLKARQAQLSADA